MTETGTETMLSVGKIRNLRGGGGKIKEERDTHTGRQRTQKERNV